jgi:RNA polymerase sigma-70 factor (ECF subfamily)
MDPEKPAIVGRIAAMDRDTTFKKLYDEYRDRIYRMCCNYVSGEEDRKDLYQETLHNIWKGLAGFRGDSALSTWVYRVTVNTSLSYLSKQKSQRNKSKAYDEHRCSQINSSETESGENDFKQLYGAIAQLPLIDMIIMSLVLEEASSAEIAEATGLTESNVRVRIHRAKEKLRGLIDGEESFEENGNL